MATGKVRERGLGLRLRLYICSVAHSLAVVVYAACSTIEVKISVYDPQQKMLTATKQTKQQ